MTLHDRIANPDRRQSDLTPVVERRQPEPRLPEWRRRALEQHERVGYVAVTDLTRSAA